MDTKKPYTQHEGRVVEDARFAHVMALTLDPSVGYTRGVIRCITSREGSVAEKGFIDKSELYRVSGDTLERFSIGERLEIKNKDEIVRELSVDGLEFLGLEDPDIWIDEQTGLTHLYFTMPFLSRAGDEERFQIHLGHAVGKSLESLEMTMPVLRAGIGRNATAKEVSIAPLNGTSVRLNLFESSNIEGGIWYSTVRTAIAHDMGKPWEF